MKTSKQKCLEMWEWLRDNPGKNKRDYKAYLAGIDKENEYEFCWACEEAKEHKKKQFNICTHCPITWPKVTCLESESPYIIWEETVRNKDPFNTTNCIKACEDIIELIKTTWED